MLKRWFSLVIFAILAAACTTFEVMIEKPSTPDLEAVSTLASLMLEGTQYAQILAERGVTPEPALPPPTTGHIAGKLCYPGTTTPSLTMYFLNTNTNEITEIWIDEYQEEYYIELAPGDYYVFAWVPQYLVGGLFSQKAVCGDNPDCVDHTPVAVTLDAGMTIEDIDLCDWGLPAEALPLPPGTQLTGVGVPGSPIE
jgi:hypothetical protein